MYMLNTSILSSVVYTVEHMVSHESCQPIYYISL